ncbi:MAG: hypothetical protein IJS04_03775 [Muribaculaceae bacterium]|nr:hypothetical protein [Muribaculaceae bacterium]
MMQKSYGVTERFDGVQKIGIRRHEVFYGLFEDEGGVYQFRGTVEYRPSLSEVKEMIIEAINRDVDEKILSGFTWTAGDGTAYKAWLSTENQFNYKSAYDLAVQTGGATLPVTFKFGTVEEPTYHEFTTLEELTDFYIKAIQFIQATLQRGWAEKDGIDLSNYQHVVEL